MSCHKPESPKLTNKNYYVYDNHYHNHNLNKVNNHYHKIHNHSYDNHYIGNQNTSCLYGTFKANISNGNSYSSINYPTRNRCRNCVYVPQYIRERCAEKQVTCNIPYQTCLNTLMKN